VAVHDRLDYHVCVGVGGGFFLVGAMETGRLNAVNTVVTESEHGRVEGVEAIYGTNGFLGAFVVFEIIKDIYRSQNSRKWPRLHLILLLGWRLD
jgi:hypothetical protein